MFLINYKSFSLFFRFLAAHLIKNLNENVIGIQLEDDFKVNGWIEYLLQNRPNLVIIKSDIGKNIFI